MLSFHVNRRVEFTFKYSNNLPIYPSLRTLYSCALYPDKPGKISGRPDILRIHTHVIINTVCPWSLDLFHLLTDYIKWIRTSWTYCILLIAVYVLSCQFLYSDSIQKNRQDFWDIQLHPRPEWLTDGRSEWVTLK